MVKRENYKENYNTYLANCKLIKEIIEKIGDGREDSEEADNLLDLLIEKDKSLRSLLRIDDATTRTMAGLRYLERVIPKIDQDLIQDNNPYKF